jgi:hypothetical protein
LIAGVIAPAVGVLSTTAAMYLWTRTDDADEAYERRRHARSVVKWSVAGSVAALIFLVTILMALVAAAAHNPLPTPTLPLR